MYEASMGAWDGDLGKELEQTLVKLSSLASSNQN